MKRKLTGKGMRVRDRMVQETAKIIREEGFKHATVREIANRANVNIAAIRYYFGSKNDLIGAAIDYLMNNFANIVHYLETTDMPAKKRLYEFMKNYFRLAHIHPALYRSISFIQSDTHQNTYFIYINLFHDRCWQPVLANIAEYTGIRNEDELNVKALQLFSALEYPLLLQTNESAVTEVNYISEKHSDYYIRKLLESLKK